MTDATITDAMLAEVERLRAELSAATAAMDAFAPLEAGNTKPLADRINDEAHDFRILCDHLSRTYHHFTNGHVSKPMTLPEVVFAIAEDIAQSEELESLPQ